MSLKLNLIKREEKNTDFNTKYFEEIIGQKSAIDQILFYGEKYEIEGIFPTLLLKGSHGLGKTYFSKKLSEALGRKFIIINCGVLKDVDEFIEEILIKKVCGNETVTLLFDESHELSKDLSTFLLSLLSPNNEGINVIEYKQLKIEYNFRYINSIFATTDTYKMLLPLVNRCRVINLELYTDEDLYKILRFYTNGLEISKEIQVSVIDACRGRARDAYLLSDDLRHASNGNGELSYEEWERYREIFNINELGLNSVEIDYLSILNEFGRMSSVNMAKKMGLNRRNIEEEVEVRLMELSLIESSSRGRILTEKGKKYCKRNVDKE